MRFTSYTNSSHFLWRETHIPSCSPRKNGTGAEIAKCLTKREIFDYKFFRNVEHIMAQVHFFFIYDDFRVS